MKFTVKLLTRAVTIQKSKAVDNSQVITLDIAIDLTLIKSLLILNEIYIVSNIYHFYRWILKLTIQEIMEMVLF